MLLNLPPWAWCTPSFMAVSPSALGDLTSYSTATAPLVPRNPTSTASSPASTPPTSLPGSRISPTASSSQLGDGATGIVVNLGDLKWLLGNPQASAGPFAAAQLSCAGRDAVAAMARLVTRFRASKVWLVGRASCETYLRCQVFYPSMEVDWDIQAVPIAPRARLSGGFFPRSMESPSPAKSFPVMESVPLSSRAKGFPVIGSVPLSLTRPGDNIAPAQRDSMCPLCSQSYQREIAILKAKEFHKTSSGIQIVESGQALPPWLQMVTSSINQKHNQAQEGELKIKQKTQELLKKWQETCSRIHSSFHHRAIDAEKSPSPSPSPLLTIPSLCTPVLLPCKSLHSSSLNLDLNLVESKTSLSPPESPVRTDLVLGGTKSSANSKDYSKETGSGFNLEQNKDKFAGVTDVDLFKKLFTGLIEQVSWQPEAASAVATAVAQTKSGLVVRCRTVPKNDTWLLFIGPDKEGKKKMAEALSELVCSKAPVTVNLGRGTADVDAEESGLSFRGRTAVDRVAEAVRCNPSSVIVLEEFDQADMLVSSSIRNAMQSGRLWDSIGRAINLGSVVFVLTADYIPDDLKCSHESLLQYEKKILDVTKSGCQLELSIGDRSRTSKRPAEWRCEGERPAKQWKESSGIGLSLDLNLAAGVEDDACECSLNSSDLTVEHEHDHGRIAVERPGGSFFPADLFDSVDETIVFKPVNFSPLRRRISESISTRFSGILGNFILLQMDDNALDRIVGGIWLSGAASKFEDWAETVLTPTILQLKSILKPGNAPIARLSLASRREDHTTMARITGDWMPSSITIVMPGLRC